MPGLFDKVATFARSPQGRRLVNQAKQYASNPDHRRRLEQLRTRLANRRGGPGPA